MSAAHEETIRKVNSGATDIELACAIGILIMAGLDIGCESLVDKFSRMFARSPADIERAHALWLQWTNTELKISADGRWAIIGRKKGNST